MNPSELNKLAACQAVTGSKIAVSHFTDNSTNSNFFQVKSARRRRPAVNGNETCLIHRNITYQQAIYKST